MRTLKYSISSRRGLSIFCLSAVLINVAIATLSAPPQTKGRFDVGCGGGGEGEKGAEGGWEMVGFGGKEGWRKNSWIWGLLFG